jgi:DNA-binding beta-propeller fold protein YncE
MFPRALIAAALAALPSVGRAAEPATLELVQTIPLKGAAGRLDHMALDAKNARLFVANLSNNSLDVVDLKAGKLGKQIPDQKKIQGVAYATHQDRIFVGNGEGGACNVFDGHDYKLLKSIKLPDADNVRYDGPAGLIYVGHAEHALSAINAETLEVKFEVKLPGQPEAFEIDLARSRVYINTVRPSFLAVVDLHERKVIAKHTLPSAEGNYPLALDAESQRLFVGCRKPSKVVAVDAKTGKELAAIDIPADIDDLFLDSKRHRLYATCGEGFLTVIAVKRDGGLEVVEKTAVPKVTRTCYFDAAGDRLYVPVPRQDGQDGPTLRVYKPKD